MTIDDDRALLMAAKARSRMAEQAQERTSVVILDSGKYTFYVRNNVLFCDRYHLKEWREFLGDKAVHALFQEVLELRERLAKRSAVETPVATDHAENLAKALECFLSAHDILSGVQSADDATGQNDASEGGFHDKANDAWRAMRTALHEYRKRGAVKTVIVPALPTGPLTPELIAEAEHRLSKAGLALGSTQCASCGLNHGACCC